MAGFFYLIATLCVEEMSSIFDVLSSEKLCLRQFTKASQYVQNEIDNTKAGYVQCREAQLHFDANTTHRKQVSLPVESQL